MKGDIGPDEVKDDARIPCGVGERCVAGHGGDTHQVGEASGNHQSHCIIVPGVAVDKDSWFLRHIPNLVVLCESVDMGQDGRFDVVVVGSANIDLVADVDSLPGPGRTLLATDYAEHAGGKGLNQAVACARMGARTAFIGCVGDDAAGRMLVDVLRSEGVDTSGVSVVGSPTGRALITVDSHGENTIVVVPGANHFVGRGGDVVIPVCGMVLAQLEIPLTTVETVMARARQRGIDTVLNPAPATELPASLVRLCDVIAPNEGEMAVLGGASALLDQGARNVVVTLGERGARVVTPEHSVDIPPHVVTPIDTVGAGDAFIGAMCAELARGSSLESACRVAAVAGALATTVRGAVPSLPTRAAVDRFLS